MMLLVKKNKNQKCNNTDIEGSSFKDNTYRKGTWIVERIIRRRVTLRAPPRRSMWSTLAVKTSWACWYHCSRNSPLISPEQLLASREWPTSSTAFFEPSTVLLYPINDDTNNTINHRVVYIFPENWSDCWTKQK